MQAGSTILEGPGNRDPLMAIRNLVVEYRQKGKAPFRAVDGVTFDIARGEVLGLAGESGSGKSTIANAILRLIEPPSMVTGEIRIGNSNILRLNAKQTKEYRWKLVAMIFQGAMNSLDPVFPISRQISETIRAHDHGVSEREALATSMEFLQKVGIAPNRFYDYPHQLSGGMRQRAVIAMALALKPKLLIADEPTSALDVVTQKQIIELVRELQKEYSLSVLFITHDLPLLSEISDRIAIMHRGRIVEMASTLRLVSEPLHPYTRLLIDSVPKLRGGKQKSAGGPSPDEPADALIEAEFGAAGCKFYPRCPIRVEACWRKDPRLRQVRGEATRAVACIRKDGWGEGGTTSNR